MGTALPVHALDVFGASVRPWVLVGWVPFFLAMVAIFRGGVRRGWPWRASLLATGAFAVGMSLGVAVLHSVLGALAGGLATWLVVQRVLGLSRPPLATIALASAAVVAVGRVGCLLGGCCFGTITELPWAVHYDHESAAWLLHHAMGAVADDAPRSLGVHPYPLYESLGLGVWLALAVPLRRRLRSEGALLALTAAWDLGLRAAIDGTRAMINVTWALEDTGLGLDRFRLALAVAALGFVALAVGLERAARVRGARAAVVAPIAEPSAGAVWGTYLALVAIGLLTDAHETAFLHGVLILALVVIAPALPLPSLPSLGRERWVLVGARASAMAMLVPLVAQLHSAVAEAPGGRPSSRDGRGWVYEVDPARQRVVRVGSASDSAEVLGERRLALGLPGATLGLLAATSTGAEVRADDPGLASTATIADDPALLVQPLRLRRPRLWLGGAAAISTLHYVQQETCSGNSRTWDRTGGGAHFQLEGELPATERSVFWLGGRLGTYQEMISVDGKRDPAGFYYLQAWGEWEHPYLTLGIGGVVGFEHSSIDTPHTDVRAIPGGHVRVGLQELGLEAGIADRASHLGPISGHLGLSGTIPRAGDAGPLLGYSLALETFGGARLTGRAMVTGAVTYHLDARSRLAFSLSVGEGAAATVGYSTVVGAD